MQLDKSFGQGQAKTGTFPLLGSIGPHLAERETSFLLESLCGFFGGAGFWRGSRLKKRILAVENDPALRKLLTLVLSRAAHEIAEADNGVEAVNQANAVHPDLIILNIEYFSFFRDVRVSVKKDGAKERFLTFVRDDNHVPFVISSGARNLPFSFFIRCGRA